MLAVCFCCTLASNVSRQANIAVAIGPGAACFVFHKVLFTLVLLLK